MMTETGLGVDGPWPRLENYLPEIIQQLEHGAFGEVLNVCLILFSHAECKI